MFTAFVTRLALQRSSNLLGDDQAGAVLRLVGRRREVRGHDDVRRLKKRARVRLLDEDIDRCSCDLARLERGDKGGLVEQLAARRVDDPHSVAHPSDLLGADRSSRRFVQRQVERDEVGTRENVVERGGLDTELAKALLGDVRVVADDFHLQAERPTRDLLADAAEAEHAEGLVGELHAAVPRAFPAALAERRVRLRDVARQRDEEADRVLGGRDDIRLGRVRNHDAASRCGVDVHIVDTDARASDHLENRRLREDLSRHLRGRPDDQGVGVDEQRLQG